MLLHLGTSVACSDGALGELADLVIHPDTRRVTHLVVAPHHHHDQARLVPFELVTPEAASKDIHLDSTTAQAHALPEAQQYAYVRIDEGPLPADDPGAVGIADVINVPMDDYGSRFARGSDQLRRSRLGDLRPDPAGEVEERQESRVVGSDGERIGRLDGLVVDEQGTIMQLVLERGHLWGRRRVTIPADAVAQFDMDGVTLAISKSQVAKILPVGSGQRLHQHATLSPGRITLPRPALPLRRALGRRRPAPLRSWPTRSTPPPTRTATKRSRRLLRSARSGGRRWT